MDFNQSRDSHGAVGGKHFEYNMKNYYRIILGKKNCFADECFEGRFIGCDFGFKQDLTGELPDDWREFNQKMIPRVREKNPNVSKISAGLSCGFLWTIAKGIKDGDIVLCPNGTGMYYVGIVRGDYFYRPDEILPHRRAVEWMQQKIAKEDMSEPLRNSTGSGGTVCNITKYDNELEQLINQITPQDNIADTASFEMEKHLEDFLVKNWANTEFGAKYNIFENEDGEQIGQQYLTDTGPLDILAISKDRKELLVVELKRGQASDVAVGQILRYMGYVAEELLEEEQSVSGAIVALEDDIRLRRALVTLDNVSFYRYHITFKLEKI